VAESHYKGKPLKLDLKDAVREALANRLEIERENLDLERTELDLALAKSRRSPSLNLSGGYSYAGVGEEEYEAFLIFQIPLVDGGEGRAEIEEAESRLEAAYLGLEKLKRDIRTEVRSHFFDVQRKMRQIELLRLSQDWYEKDLDIARSRFLSGAITENELTKKDIESKQSEIALLDAILDYEASRSAFLRSLGRGL